MRSIVAGEGESGSNVSSETLNFLDVGDQFFVNRFLNVLGLGSPFGFGVFSLLGLFSGGFGSVLKLVLGETSLLFEEIVSDVGVHSSQRNFGGGCQNV